MSQIATVAEEFYLPPPSMQPTAWDGVPGAERCIVWYEHKAQRSLPRPADTLPPEEARYARIDAGRWVADSRCGSAQVISVTDPRMMCVECLTGWYPLVLPPDIAAAEAEVAHLPAHERFWWHSNDPARPLPPTFPEP